MTNGKGFSKKPEAALRRKITVAIAGGLSVLTGLTMMSKHTSVNDVQDAISADMGDHIAREDTYRTKDNTGYLRNSYEIADYFTECFDSKQILYVQTDLDRDQLETIIYASLFKSGRIEDHVLWEAAKIENNKEDLSDDDFRNEFSNKLLGKDYDEESFEDDLSDLAKEVFKSLPKNKQEDIKNNAKDILDGKLILVDENNNAIDVSDFTKIAAESIRKGFDNENELSNMVDEANKDGNTIDGKSLNGRSI